MKYCSTCHRIVGENEPVATCTCGEIYCRDCIGVLSADELRDVLEDAKSKGHIVTNIPCPLRNL